MKRIILVFLMLLIVPITLTTQAQITLNPDYNDYNWCGDPAVWGSGHCVTDDPDLEYCLWQMGWYLPRVASGEFGMSDIQTPCLLMIPEVEVIEVDSGNGCKGLHNN